MTDSLDKLTDWTTITARTTDGPWPVNGSRLGEVGQVWGLNWRNDAEFIATSRTAMPALLTAVEAVLNDHEPEPYTQGADYCRECCHRWPCATVSAIRDAIGGAQ